MKVAILIDEGNAIQQLHLHGVHGFKTWKSFYETIEKRLELDFKQKIDVSYHFYGSLPPKHCDQDRYFDRKRFFDRLSSDGIHVHKGLCLLDNGNLREKGVDLLLGLDLYEFSLNQYDILFLFSGDTDLVPAIERAKLRSKVVTILSRHMPSKHVIQASDGILYLEKILNMNEENLNYIEKEGFNYDKFIRTA